MPSWVPTLSPSTKQPTRVPTSYPSLSPSTVFTITTIAGTGISTFSGDNGAATSAALYYPYRLALDASGTRLFIPVY